MAENKAAITTSLGTHVYKNSRYTDAKNIILPNNEYLKNTIYIPSISNLKTGVIDQMTARNYNGATYYIIEEDVNTTSRLDFGDNDITFMRPNRDQGDKKLGLADLDLYNSLTDLNFKLDTERYGIGNPNIIGYSYISGEYVPSGIFYAYPQELLTERHSSASSVNRPTEFFATRYKGTKKHPLNVKYYEETDTFLIPSFRNKRQYTDSHGNPVIIGSNDKYCGNNISVEGIGFFGITNYSSDDFDIIMPYKGGRNNNISTIAPTFHKNGETHWDSFYCKQNDDEYFLYIPKSIVNGYYTADYSFIYDDINNEILIMLVLINHNGNNVATLITPLSVFGILNQTQSSPPLNLSTLINSLMGNLIDAKDIPNFDDGAPDISGPGDPYNTDEFNNIGSSVGGDADPGKDLNSVDATPNTAFNSFMQATGFFGSYVLSNEDLVEYTNTLKMLYSHASDIFFGEAASLQADRITKNTIGLHMLPLTIPPADYADTIFSMGNVGIAATDNYSDYKTGNNYAHANYLTKLTRIFNVPLGTIKHNYDNFLDFAPYSSASLYIPYIGKVELPINLIQSTSSDSRPLRLEFRVDYTSGDFMAILFCNINRVDIALSHWNGNCARTVKVSVNDDSSAIIAGANRLASMFSASMSMTSGSNNFGGTLTGSNSNIRNNYYEDKKMNSSMNLDQTSSGKTGGMTFSTPSAPTSVTTNQHMIGNGSADGELGYLGIQDIVLTVERPVWWRPYDYGNLVGYPTKKVAKLASVKGFARVSDAHIRCMATATEKDEIATLLAKGVIF